MEPIAARQTTWSYRVIKKARKHRALFRLIEADPELTVWIDQFNALAGAPAA